MYFVFFNFDFILLFYWNFFLQFMVVVGGGCWMETVFVGFILLFYFVFFNFDFNFFYFFVKFWIVMIFGGGCGDFWWWLW